LHSTDHHFIAQGPFENTQNCRKPMFDSKKSYFFEGKILFYAKRHILKLLLIISPDPTGRGAHPPDAFDVAGIKQPCDGVDHSPPFSAEVKGNVELCHYFPSGPSRPVLG